jgi:hypothetical protein
MESTDTHEDAFETLWWTKENPNATPLYNEAQVLVRIPSDLHTFGFLYFVGMLIEFVDHHVIVVHNGETMLRWRADEVEWAFLG